MCPIHAIFCVQLNEENEKTSTVRNYDLYIHKFICLLNEGNHANRFPWKFAMNQIGF